MGGARALSLSMKSIFFTLSGLLPLTGMAVEFEAPYRLKVGDAPIQVEPPGYAAPALYDLDGDGEKDLLVGQFRDGKITIYPGKGEGLFDKGALLKAGGEVVKILGVW